MTKPARYLLDADAFIRSKREHYGFDICAGYWEALLKAHEKKRVSSIIPVRNELLKGKDDLTKWVQDHTPKPFFKEVKDPAVQSALSSVNDWVMSNSQYSQPAKELFLRGADPWLVAYANVNGYVVSTYEVAAPDSKAKVKLPDVAMEFKVDCCQPFDMLRALRVRLRLASSSFK